ncbi:MAG: magnesium chelatase subunit H [Vallitalea sp.]|nr:magnesium chelatase subunit H [Vallitalea sp.]
MKVTVISVSTSVITGLIKVQEEINSKYNNVLELRLFYASRTLEDSKLESMENDISNSDVTFVDLMGSPKKVISAVMRGLEKCKGNIIPIGGAGRNYLKLGELTSSDMGMNKKNNKSPKKPMDMAKMQKMANMAEKMGKLIPVGKPKDMRNFVQIGKYFQNATNIQLMNMMYLLLRDYGKVKAIPKPQESDKLPDIGLCDPRTKMYFDDYKEYGDIYDFDSNKPTVALLFYGHTYPNDTSTCVAEIADKIRAFANVLPIAFSKTKTDNQDLLKEWLLNATGRKVNLIINFMSFRLGAGPMGGNADYAVSVLEDVNVPIFHPFFMSKRREREWLDSVEGINSSEFLLSVMLPELDGAIETYPIGAMAAPKYNSEFDIEIRELSLIDDRVLKLVSRVKNWLQLQSKMNLSKKVAIICYNYPPGEDNLFGGAFLDTFNSVENMLKELNSNGYNVDTLSAHQLMESFTAGKIVNSGRWSDEESQDNFIKYRTKEYNKDMEDKWYRDEMLEQWGEAPGDVMSDGENFLIPGIINGNIFIGLQPTRGIHEDPEKVYHDKTLLPPHQYIAFYQWLKEEFKADVIIHVGTHGTLEFLKGKECGMSSKCLPDMLVSDLPHLYMYYCGNPAEAMIAKRRSHAALIGYQPPTFIEGELYGEYAKLSAMIDEYHEALRISPVRSEDVYNNIMKKAEENNLPKNLDEIESELYRMNRSLIPKGLHVFGKPFDNEEVYRYVEFVLRYDRGNIKSLRRILAINQGYDYDEILENNEVKLLKEIDREVKLLIDTYWKEEGEINSSLNIKDNLRVEIDNTMKYAEDIISKCNNNNESKGLLKLLNGEYLKAKLAGDTIRNPEVMPSGYNLYQFDPRFVPSVTAYERGRKIAENTIDQYLKEHGEYPKSIAVVLWGLETSRTQGETVGQIMAYLGIRLGKSISMWEPKYEIIPKEELKRPRIDVVINMCGFFRDMFSNIINDLNELFETIYELDESNDTNYFKANSKKLYKKLLSDGYEKEEAIELCKSRIFGPAEGEYGTGVTKLFETKNWEDESQIGDTFVKSIRHVYSKNHRGKEAEKLLNNNLSSVDIVSQIRSNHEYEVTDLDHYYEFFGGLAKSVEMAKGSKAEIYITDTTGEKVETESVEKSINRGIRTRVLNPKWIDGMLEHKYHGVQNIADKFENIMGLAATTNKVEEWIYDDLHSKYIDDEEMRKRLKDNNRWAYFSIVEQMIEYDKRGYWNASDEQKEKLLDIYLELEGDIEEDV